MRNILLVTMFSLVAGAAVAQGGATQSPPSPNASSAGAQPNNSVPAGAANTQGAPTTGVLNPGSVPPALTPSGSANAIPPAPSGSTGNQPGAAFQQTVPQPVR